MREEALLRWHGLDKAVSCPLRIHLRSAQHTYLTAANAPKCPTARLPATLPTAECTCLFPMPLPTACRRSTFL